MGPSARGRADGVGALIVGQKLGKEETRGGKKKKNSKEGGALNSEKCHHGGKSRVRYTRSGGHQFLGEDPGGGGIMSQVRGGKTKPSGEGEQTCRGILSPGVTL